MGALLFKRLETVRVDFFLDRHLGVGLGPGKVVQALLRPNGGRAGRAPPAWSDRRAGSCAP